VNEYLVYKHTAPNGKAYIGQTHDYQKRCREHKNKKGCIAFHRAIQKYGWNNFKHEILKDGLTIEEANHWEEFYIKRFNTIKPNGYNIRSGGNNSRLHESSKKKIGDANRGRIVSEETRKKLATFKGKNHTESHKTYMSNKLKGRKFSPETIEKMRQAAIKRMSNPEYKAKCSKGFIKKDHIKTEAHRSAISKKAKER
jgi:group I intron endonuclease